MNAFAHSLDGLLGPRWGLPSEERRGVVDDDRAVIIVFTVAASRRPRARLQLRTGFGAEFSRETGVRVLRPAERIGRGRNALLAVRDVDRAVEPEHGVESLESQLVPDEVAVTVDLLCEVLLHRLLQAARHLACDVDQRLLAAVLQHLPSQDHVRNLIPAVIEAGSLPQVLSSERARSFSVISRNGLVTKTHLPRKASATLIGEHVARTFESGEHAELPHRRNLFSFEVIGNSCTNCPCPVSG